METPIESKEHRYEVGKLVGKAKAYRLYVANQEDTGRQVLLQVAVEAADNGTLDRVALFLRDLAVAAEKTEAEYAEVKTDPKVMLNYGLGFPELVESFICKEQGGRRINVLAFCKVDEVSRMVPIHNIIVKDEQRIDLRTSVWIMGKLLKLLAFAHDNGFAIRLLNTRNILIEPEQHYVLIFDWSHATREESVSREDKRDDIVSAAKTVVALLWGDEEVGEISSECMGRDDFAVPEESTKEAGRYMVFLHQLNHGEYDDAGRAHEQLYEFADKAWPREFHPFTSCFCVREMKEDNNE